MTSGETPGGGWVPVPDPTVLTTAQLLRELGVQREFLELQIDALKELTLARFAAADAAVRAALESSEKAVAKAETATEKRFDAVNAFRAQLSDQAGTFLTRREHASAHDAIAESISDLRQQLSSLSAQIVPRLETEAWRQALTEKMEIATGRSSDAIAALASRLDLGAGASAGQEQQVVTTREVNNQRLLFLGVAISVVVIVVNVIIALAVHGGKL